jgi:hypothetical protein
MTFAGAIQAFQRRRFLTQIKANAWFGVVTSQTFIQGQAV